MLKLALHLVTRRTESFFVGVQQSLIEAYAGLLSA
jgi:hypothetical protein